MPVFAHRGRRQRRCPPGLVGTPRMPGKTGRPRSAGGLERNSGQWWVAWLPPSQVSGCAKLYAGEGAATTVFAKGEGLLRRAPPPRTTRTIVIYALLPGALLPLFTHFSQLVPDANTLHHITEKFLLAQTYE